MPSAYATNEFTIVNIITGCSRGKIHTFVCMAASSQQTVVQRRYRLHHDKAVAYNDIYAQVLCKDEWLEFLQGKLKLHMDALLEENLR